MEDVAAGGGWPRKFRAFMMSAPVNADLLDAANWTSSNPVASSDTWLGGTFRGWLEGNAVVTPAGQLVNILRADITGYPEKAAIINVSTDGTSATFDPGRGFIDFPGGAKKFTIRFDRASSLYWSVATPVQPPHQNAGIPGVIRNTLALVSSPDLTNWLTRCILHYHPDTGRHGFQYPDWQFDGDDLIAVVRTAHADGLGGANNYHDANFLTFHRVRSFRTLTPADSYRYAESVMETDDLKSPVTCGAAHDWTIRRKRSPTGTMSGGTCR
jgi:hypothetical protein